MPKHNLIFYLMAVLLLLCSCDNDLYEENESDEAVLEVSDIAFSPDYKTYDIYASIKDDSKIRDVFDFDSLSVREYNNNGSEIKRKFRARVTGIDNIGAKIIDSIGIKLQVLVDLTLPQNLVDSQLVYVQQIHRLYCNDNLYISFLHSDSITPSTLITDYIVEHSFVSEADTLSTSKRLYRAIFDMIIEVYDTTTVLGANDYTALIIFSDGNIYNIDATPIDPDHFYLQTAILNSIPDHDGRPIFYFNIDNSKQGAVNDASNFMQLLTDKSCGLYSDYFEWQQCEDMMLDRLDVRYYDYCIHFENPDDRLYDGTNNLQLYMNCGDVSIPVINTYFSVGTTCKPIIVNGKPMVQVLIQGLLISLLLILLVYLACQIIIPYIRYCLFRKHHIAVYHGPNSTVEGVVVADTCYYCKAPFRPGDSIVAKCEHTMHESCWHENGDHCPEYGKHCKSGSHYYNESNLFDPRNAVFYLKWLIVSVVVAFIAWFGFIVYDQEISFNLLLQLYANIKDIQPDSAEMYEATVTLANKLEQLPSFGAFLGIVITFSLGLMVCPYYSRWRMARYIVLRSLLSGIVGYLLFLIGFIISVAVNADYSSFLIDWLPWTGTAFFSVMAATFHTIYKPRHKWLIGMLSVGFFSMFLWDIIFSSSSSDYRILLFASNIVFVLGVTLSVAKPDNRSSHFVLHISGCVKEMDIAIYKYFLRSPHSHVTIGQSIDCSIQTSWDIQGNVAALNAEIVQYKGRLCLIPLEDGVYIGNRMLKVGNRYELYHGRSFCIGTTTFTFHERDNH